MLRTRRLELVNEKGDVVASVSPMGEGYPGIAVCFGGRQRAEIWLMSAKGGLTIGMNDAQNRHSAGMVLGGKGGPVFSVADEELKNLSE